MLPIKNLLLASVLLCATQMSAQFEHKSLEAQRCNQPPRINGQFDDACWMTAPKATDFISDRPSPGQRQSQKSEVQLVYDDEAIYIAFMNYDTEPDSILTQLTGRDSDGNSDYCGVTFGCYKDGINGFTFAVSPLGEQFDAREGLQNGDGGGEDVSWNAVWECKTEITEQGWTAEYRIPFAAIRFPDVAEQVWDINFVREVRRHREHAFWRGVNPEIPGFMTQMGTLTGIKNIKPPLRLFFYPYASAYADVVESELLPVTGATTSYNAGMDVKIGLSEAFTLDATLIPDFGQTISDALILNTTPFEVRFDENRQFFTEGTELFSKAGIFYSRRIGQIPYTWDYVPAMDSTEYLHHAPRETQLYNATKISGRMKNGLGIGFFNSVTAPAYAEIRNEETNETREEETHPLSNYNILVFDQNLKNNSFVSLINTNVLRDGAFYDANVTGTQFQLRNKKNSYGISGSGAFNQKFNWNDPETENGFTYNMSLDKISGNWNWSLGTNTESTHYDPNDLGFLSSPNQQTYWAWMGYNIYEPFGPFNRMWSNFEFWYDNLYEPSTFTGAGVNWNIGLMTRKWFSFNIQNEFIPVRGYDYFEPRLDGWLFRTPMYENIGAWISTDYRKTLAWDVGAWYGVFSFPGNYEWNYRIAPRLRVNDHLMLNYVYSYQSNINNVGFADFIYDEQDNAIEPVMGTRDVISHTNVLSASYAFNPVMIATCRVRHYWGFSEYHQFHGLDYDGELVATTYDGHRDDGTTTADDSFNSFTIDLQYKWIFAPGSEISLVWKNSITHFEHDIPSNLLDDVEHTFGLPQANSISMKVLYFLDYRSIFGKG